MNDFMWKHYFMGNIFTNSNFIFNISKYENIIILPKIFINQVTIDSE